MWSEVGVVGGKESVSIVDIERASFKNINLTDDLSKLNSSEGI